MKKKKPETYYQEIVRKYITKKCGCDAVRELNFGGPKFDVVGFSPDTEEFHIVECKCTSKPVGIGQTFGQILAYKAMIYDAGEQFLDCFSRALFKDGIKDLQFWKQAVRFVDNRKIPVKFYVSLLDGACSHPGIIRLIKKDLPEVGIIRINNQSKCREYIRYSGQKDYSLCSARRVDVPIAMPIRDDLRTVLNHKKSNPAR